MLDPVTIARAAALALAPDRDPSLPERTEKAFSGTEGDCDAAFLVDAARHACRIATAAPAGTADGAFAFERRLRRELGLDDGMAADLDAVVAAIAEQIVSHDRAPGR
jgi:hypothetical protein